MDELERIVRDTQLGVRNIETHHGKSIEHMAKEIAAFKSVAIKLTATLVPTFIIVLASLLIQVGQYKERIDMVQKSNYRIETMLLEMRRE